IDDGAYDPRMDIAVLRQIAAERQLDRAVPGPEIGDSCADQAHRSLPIETRFHPRGVLGIGRNEARPRAGCGLRHQARASVGDGCWILLYVYVNVNATAP